MLNLDLALREEEKRVHLDRIRIATYYMAIPLVLSFSAVDYFFRPDLVGEFFKVRLLVIPVAAIMHFLLKIPEVKRRLYYLPSLVLGLFLGLYSAYLTYRTGGASSSYYAGLSLLAIGGLSFLPWPRRLLPVVFLVFFGPYFASLLLDENIQSQYLVPNLAFLISSVFLSGVAHELTARLRRKEVEARLLLKNEIETKDQVIEDKTRHGIFLEKLALQFSPQVIDAVKGGNLDLGDRKRQLITSIFIDIENSTARASKLDFLEYQNLISNFFSACIDILLHHDVTVGTYLGDGILAFANAPLDQADHSQRALAACLDILRMVERKRTFYSQHWRSDFNIRIGINSGFALVGFFPNAKRGTYTAIGESVNLASRLCGAAAPNSICATKAFLRENANSLRALTIENKGNVANLKGFEGETFELFFLKPLKLPAQNAEEVMRCPLCDGSLVVAEVIGDAEMIKCSSCNYHDLRILSANQQVA